MNERINELIINEHGELVQTYGKGVLFTQRKTCPSTTLATTNVTWNALVLNWALSGQRQRITNCAIKRPCLCFVQFQAQIRLIRNE